MNNSDQDRLDQRSSPVTEDPTAMTIEFLRARLLSERSVSKSARQRADELAKRVAELEEQLRFVSLQRMKAEKATADVLAILESSGMSDVSETSDSSSDQDSPCEPKTVNTSSKEVEDSVNSNVRKSESQENSVSDFDFPEITARSLSWKGSKNSPRSIEKYKDPSVRRRSSFAFTGYSPKHRLGKSCPKVRGKESRSANEELKDSSLETNARENGVANTTEVFPNCSDACPGTSGRVTDVVEDKVLPEVPPSGCQENEHNGSNTGHAHSVYRSDRGMEKALEHRAQLIGQYEGMEKAQREWEEKFRENNNSTPDSCDPGNLSDITEDRFEIKAETSLPAEVIITETQDVKSDVRDLYKTRSNDIIPPSFDEVGDSTEQRNTSTPASESPTQDFEFFVEKDKQNEEFRSEYHPQSHSSDRNPYSHGYNDPSRSKSAASFPSSMDDGLSKERASGSQNELYALVPHGAPNERGSVLEALRQARQSLQEKINTLSLTETRSAGKLIESSVPTTIPGDRIVAPVGSAGLFRLPTDFSVEANNRANFLNPSAHLSLGNHHPDKGLPVANSGSFVSSTYMESRSSFPLRNHFLISPPMDGGSRFSSQRPHSDTRLDTGFPSSSRYTYPHYPVSPSYPDLMPQVPMNEGFPTFNPQRAVRMPPADHFPFSNDHARPNTYR